MTQNFILKIKYLLITLLLLIKNVNYTSSEGKLIIRIVNKYLCINVLMHSIQILFLLLHLHHFIFTTASINAKNPVYMLNY